MPYRPLTRLAGAALDLTAAVRGRDQATHSRLRDRLVLGEAPAPALIWLHAASVGEVTSAATVIRTLAERASILVTTNTAAGRDAAAALGVAAALAPLDTPQALTRFLDRVIPRVAVTIENELWPNRSAALAERGIPQIVIGARLSARSAARWDRVGWLLRPMLARITALSAQDSGSEARFLALGLPPEALLAPVNLKLIGAARRRMLKPGPHRTQTVLAASTHEGEEALILDAVASLPRQPRLIVAPRHPQRFAAVAASMAARGLAPAMRSAGADASDAPVLLADTMGEMDRWYAAAGICVTGGSLVPRGGHTPWEPAAQGCAILHGPSVDNFAADYALLDSAGAARAVTAASLGGDLADLVGYGAAQRRMGSEARAILERSVGDSAPLIDRIASFALI